MCAPLLAIAAVQIAASVAQHAGERKAAKIQEGQIAQGLADSYAESEASRHQQSQAATDQMTERSQQGMRDLGQINTIFADSGLDGATHDRIANEVAAGVGADETTLQRNRSNASQQSSFEESAARQRAQQGLNATKHPSILGTGLKIASSVASAYAGGGFGGAASSK